MTAEGPRRTEAGERSSREVLRSRSNPLLKRLRGVAAGREPETALLEGLRLVQDALASGFELEALLAEEDVDLPPELDAHPNLRRVAPGLLVGSVKTSPGVAALASMPPAVERGALRDAPPGLWVAVAGIQDPSNLGAVARVVEAAGARGLCLGPRGARASHPRALRASMGSLLRLPRVELHATNELALPGWRHAVATTRGGADYRTFDWTPPLVLWLGDERGGSTVRPPAGAEPVSIPLEGPTESLNVALAAALLVFEAARRRV